MAYAADGRILFLQDDQGTLRRWDAVARAMLTPFSDGEQYSAFAVSANGTVLAGVTHGGALRVWDLNGNRLLFERPTTPQGVSRIAVTNDGQTVAWTFARSGSKGIVVCDMVGGSTKEIPELDVYPLRWPVISPDGQLLVVQLQSRFGTSTVWDITTDPPSRRYEVTGWGPELCAAFSPQGDTLAVGSYNYDIRLHDARSGALTHTLRGHSDRVNAVAFASDGSRLVSGGSDGAVRIWDPELGELLSTLTGQAGQIVSVSVPLDKTSVASLSSDQSVRIWDARPGYVEEGSPNLLPALARRVANGTAT